MTERGYRKPEPETGNGNRKRKPEPETVTDLGPCASPGCAPVQSVYRLIEQNHPGPHRKSRSPSSPEQRHAVAISWNHRLRCVLERELGASAAMLVYQWTNQSSPPDGGRNALMPHPVWVGAYIVRRLVAGRSFALKKLG